MTDYSTWPVLKRNSNNAAVQTVRAALKARGYEPGYTVLDPNLYDAWVEASVIDFQKKSGLYVDGVVGKNTWTALLGSGAQPNTVPGASADSSQPGTTTPGLDVGLASGRLVTFTNPVTGGAQTVTVPPGVDVKAYVKSLADAAIAAAKQKQQQSSMSTTTMLALGIGALLVVYLLTQKRKSLI